MNEQEMQFADPDWKPSGPLSEPQGDVSADAAVPRPGTSGAYNTNQYADMAPYQQGYRGSLPEEETVSISPVARQAAAASAGATRRRSWWIWLGLIVLFIALVSGISRPFDRGPGNFGAPFQGPFQRPFPKEQVSTYDLKNASQISISNQLGSIGVQVAGGNSTQVVVQAQGDSQPVVTYTGKSMNITTGNGEGANLLITVPQNVALNLTTVAGGIEVDGFTGQLSAQTTYGALRLTNDILSGQSKISSDSGYIGLGQGSLADSTIIDQRGSILLDQEHLSGQVKISAGGNGAIAFNGTLDPQGSYQFITDTGTIDLALPASISMQTQVSAGSGSYHSDFPRATGSSPQAEVTLQTNGGDITILKQ